ncbi:CopD family protein [Nitrososphaera sp.]|uniref:CopD family protein n=1 Tax=Nitrososphaera sp. TaxID=1971748 RepID=UPI00307F9D55
MAVADGLVTWIHLIGSSIWVGGSIFIAAVAVPVLRSHFKDLDERVGLMVKVGRQFNRVTVPAFAILVATGIYNARAFISYPGALADSTYGVLLLIKIILVLATIGAYVVHVKTLNADMERRILSGNAGSVYVQSVRSKIIHLGRVMVGLSIAILLLAALLDSGGL